LYVIVWLPDPAIPGSNVLPTTPVPDQIPPEVAAERATAISDSHNGPTGAIVTSGIFSIVM